MCCIHMFPQTFFLMRNILFPICLGIFRLSTRVPSMHITKLWWVILRFEKGFLYLSLPLYMQPCLLIHMSFTYPTSFSTLPLSSSSTCSTSSSIYPTPNTFILITSSTLSPFPYVLHVFYFFFILLYKFP